MAVGFYLAAPVSLYAQIKPIDAELKALIPDAAVADPQVWAKKTTENGTVDSQTADDLKPTSPLSGVLGAQLDWPETASTKTEETVQPLASAVAETSLPAPNNNAGVRSRAAGKSVDLTFTSRAADFPEREEFEQRFTQLSGLQNGQTAKGTEGESLVQLAVRAAADRDLLLRLLRVYGYYDGDISQSINAAGIVQFDINQGIRYRYGLVDLGELTRGGDAMAHLRHNFAIKPGDPLQNDRILEEKSHLDVALGEMGYAFATLGEVQLTVDHRREEGDLFLPVSPGDTYKFGEIISGNPKLLSSRHLTQMARFKAGQMYKRSAVDDLRRAILATGLVSSLNVTPREMAHANGEKTGVLALDMAMIKAPPRTLAGAIGYDTGDGFRLEASWEHRNLFPPEGMLRLRGILGTHEQLAGITFRRSNFRGRDRTLTLDLYADNANRSAYAARALAFAANYERQTTLLFQKPWTWSFGGELMASAEREGTASAITTGRINYLTAALPMRAAYDGSDDLLDPKRGWRTSLRISPEISFSSGSKSEYAKIQWDASAYLPASKGVVLAGRMRLGAMPGTNIANIAPSRRFYAGGGGSLRGFGYQLVGPRNVADEPMGGRSLYEFSLEARLHTGLVGGAPTLVPILDAGGVDADSIPKFSDIRYGVGLGLRYQTGFGPIRVDVGTPLNRRRGDSRIGVYVALGQAF